MSVYKNNRDKWCIDIDNFFHADGRKEPRIRKTSPVQSKRGAEQYERDIRQSLLEGTRGKRINSDDIPTVAEFKDVYMESYRGEKRKASGTEDKESLFRAHLIPLFGDRKVTSFGLADQRALRSRFAENKSSSRYNGACAALNKLIELYYEENKLPNRFKFKILKVVDAKKPFYDFEQYGAMVVAAPKLSDTAELVCLLGGDAGLRRGEMFALGAHSCDMRNRLLTIDRSEVVVKGKRYMSYTKGNDVRYVDMTSRLHAALGRFLSAHKHAERLLVDANGDPFTPESFRDDLMVPLQELAGVKVDGNVHILRHTFCSHLAIRGVPIMTIKELAGHKNIKTTLGYMHLARGDKRRAINMLEEAPPQ